MTDLAVHPKTRNAFLSVMRGQGAGAKAVLLRVDGAGKIEVVDFGKTTASQAAECPAANSAQRGRSASITDMAFVDGQLYVAGLSNEEFASKLRSVAYPFATVDSGTSVEIFHGNHGQFETRSPVYTFVPYRVQNATNLIAGYLCTPLVKFPVTSLKPGAKVMGTTIAELGNRNRPIDMIVYKKDGQEFLLMSNNSRGVMKIPTEQFGSAPPITAPVNDKGGIGYETVDDDEGRRAARPARREPLDRAGARRAGALNLTSSRCRSVAPVRRPQHRPRVGAGRPPAPPGVGAVSCGIGPGPRPLEIQFDAADGRSDAATVQVVGIPPNLSPARGWTSDQWASALRVTVVADTVASHAEAAAPAIIGTYTVERDSSSSRRCSRSIRGGTITWCSSPQSCLADRTTDSRRSPRWSACRRET